MRKSLVFSVVGAMALAASAVAALAAEGAGSPESADSVESVIVAATRLPTPEWEIASSVTVITAEDIAARQERSLPDILKDVPGLNIVRTGGPGGQTVVFMRGTNSNHTKVLVDGIDVSDPSNSTASFDFSQFLTQDIERVEVLRGPQSGLYGSDAIGGVINVITKSGQGPAQFQASAEGGSFETFNQTAGVRGSVEQFHYNANVEHFHSGATPVTPLDLLAPGETRNDDYYDNLTAATKLGYDVVQNFDVGLVARYTNSHLRVTGDDFSTFPTFPAAQQTRTSTSEYYSRATAHLVSFDGFLDQTLGVAYTRKRTSTLEPASAQEGLATGERTKIDWQGALKFTQAHTLVLGAEHARDEISEPISASNQIDSGYAELQSQLIRGLYSAINARYDKNDRFGGKVTYRVAPAYVIPGTGTKLKASVGSGFKAPTLSELFQSYPAFFFIANPNLRPETSTGYDVGVEQALVGETLRVGVTYYYNRVRKLIVSAPSPYGINITYANIGRAHTDGVESFVAYNPVKAITLRADYTYTQATDDGTGQELLRRPKHKASLNAAWQATSAFSLNATVLTVSSWIDGNRDFSIPRLTAPGYTVVNLAASFAIDRHLTVFGRLDNLFDRHFQNPVGFLQPTGGAFAGIRAQL
ncbi:MAG: ligand-gated channel protein [Gammaproteobacteria bacterium]|nr:ligand-gated channel protein [Gammaproteobacteria bacterium]